LDPTAAFDGRGSTATFAALGGEAESLVVDAQESE